MYYDKNVISSFSGLFGIPVDIGSSILLLAIVFIGFSTMGGDLLWSLSVFAMLVGSIYLHELGHALGALVQRVPVRRIMLYGGGGFCELRRSTSRREEELIVAMGPIVNFTLWALSSLGVHWVLARFAGGHGAMIGLLPYLSVFATINLWLGLFNMLPVQPLDGGRLFRLFLARVLSPVAARRVTGGVGVLVALAWWPALALLFWTTGWILFFLPSIRHHWDLLRR